MKISGADRALGAIGYLPVLFLLPLLLRRDSLFIQFHARQGMVLFLLELAWIFVFTVLLLFMGSINFAASILIGLWMLGTAVYAFFVLVGILKVLLGERYRMPLVADIALKMGL